MDNRYYDNVIAEMQSFLDENNFKAEGDSFVNDTRKITVKYNEDRQTYSLLVAVKEDGEYSEDTDINTWLFDDSQNAKDAESVGIDFVNSLKKNMGIRSYRGIGSNIELPTASKNGNVNINGFTKKMLDVFPSLKDPYKDYVALYGNFLYINFFGEFLVPELKAVFEDGNKKQIKKVYEAANEETGQKEVNCVIVEGLDTEFAMKLLGSEKLFWAVLKDYYQAIDKKAKLIKSLEEAEDWHGYTIEVHALKSASKQVGATELSEKAARLEKAGNEEDGKLIHQCTEEMLEQYLGYLDILKPYFPEEQKENTASKMMETAELYGYIDNIRTAAEDLDFDAIEYVLEIMSEYKYEGKHEELFGRLKDAVAEYDVDTCEEIMNEWEGLLSV